MSTSSAVPGEFVPGSGVPGDPGSSAPLPGWPDYYTVNFCPNPSVETDTTGFSPVTGDETLAQALVAYSGKYGLQVTTPGNVPGEGVATPPGVVIAYAQGSMSLYVYGTSGLLTVSAIESGTGQVLGSVPVSPGSTGDWQRVELDQLTMTAGSAVYLEVTTVTAQAVTFYIDAVQYEPSTPAHAYVDGDQQYAATDTVVSSDDSGRMRATAPVAISYQTFQNPASGLGGMVLEGTISVVLPGAVVTLAAITGQMDMSGDQFPMAAVSSPARTVIAPATDTGVKGYPWFISGGGSVTVVTVAPGSRFAQFAVYSSADPDPAMTLIGANNAGTENGKGSWERVYGTFSPPQQQLDSQGNAVWQAAAYMAAGFRIAGQGAYSTATPNGVNFTQVQIEKATGTTPSPYRRPRSLSTIVKPTSMNFITNPSIEDGTTGWSGTGAAQVTRVAGGYQGSYSLQVTVTAAGDGAAISVPELILGDVFCASAYVTPVSDNIAGIDISVGGTYIAGSYGSTYPFGDGGYGSGTFGGGTAPGSPMTPGTWLRPWEAFTAAASTVSLALTPVAVPGAVYPLVFNIDCVMVTPGEVLEAYADGSSDGWQWEAGGTPGLSRSYYYEREQAGANAVQSVLDMHIPLGLTAYAPQFAVPATQ